MIISLVTFELEMGSYTCTIVLLFAQYHSFLCGWYVTPCITGIVDHRPTSTGTKNIDVNRLSITPPPKGSWQVFTCHLNTLLMNM